MPEPPAPGPPPTRPGAAAAVPEGAAAGDAPGRRAADQERARAVRLVERERLLTAVMEGSRDAVTVLDVASGRYVYANPASSSLTGFTAEELVGQALEEVRDRIHPEDRPSVMRAHSDLIAGAVAESSGEYRWYSAVRRLVREDGGRPRYVVSVIRDVTDARLAEDALRASRERLRTLLANQDRLLEDQKSRIALELHDDLGQLLTALRLDVEAVEAWLAERGGDAGAAAVLERAVDASELAAESVEVLQRVVAELRPAALDRLGLGAALREEGRRFQARAGVACEVAAADLRLPREVETALFRVAQEALTNVARHAGASRAEITLLVVAGEAVLRVADDGRGLAPAESRPGATGVNGMRERLRRLGGALRVEAAAPRGTAVEARVPLAAGGR